MSASNTSQRYGAVAKTFHWLTALLILLMIPLGLIAHEAPFGTSAELARKAWLFSLHKTLGVTLFAVAVARILWALAQPKPAPLHPDRRLETWLAELVHWLLYGSLVAVPLSGWIAHAASDGYAPIWWPLGQSLPLVPKSSGITLGFSVLHYVFNILLGAALSLHVAGALKHHFIDRDATLRRMLPGRPDLPPGPARVRHARMPLLTALLIFALTAGVGAGYFTVLQDRAERRAQARSVAETAATAPAASGATSGTVAQAAHRWTVTDGTLGITVRQLGNDLSGSFADWSATITYDEAARTGSVDVSIDVNSLALGSVTTQALGAEFFAAETHPTARFAAAIAEGSDGLVADGTLSLSGTERPVRLPFTLEITGNTAKMRGSVTLDRRDFGMGPSYPDDKTVGFTVNVDVDLAAIRAD